MSDEATKEIERLRGIRKQLTKQVRRLKERIREQLFFEHRRELGELVRTRHELLLAEEEVDALLDWLGYEQPPPVMASVP